jgi:hypothetical protein
MNHICKSCLDPISHEDAICFRCLSINSKKPIEDDPLFDVLDGLIRTEHVLPREEYFPDIPPRHSDKDVS